MSLEVIIVSCAVTGAVAGVALAGGRWSDGAPGGGLIASIVAASAAVASAELLTRFLIFPFVQLPSLAAWLFLVFALAGISGFAVLRRAKDLTTVLCRAFLLGTIEWMGVAGSFMFVSITVLTSAVNRSDRGDSIFNYPEVGGFTVGLFLAAIAAGSALVCLAGAVVSWVIGRRVRGERRRTGARAPGADT